MSTTLASETDPLQESPPEQLIDLSETSTVRPRKASVNVLWNWAGVGVDAVTALIVTPLLVSGLGDDTYGLWVLIGSMTGCFGMLDLGMRGAVGRYVALYRAKGDRIGIQQVLSTAALALTTVAVLSLIGMTLMAWALPRLYEIPPSQVTNVQFATLIVGGQLSLFFGMRMFDATLWAHQRFDLINLIDIPTTLVRAGLIAWLVATGGGGLMTLAWIALASVTSNGLAKCWCSYQIVPDLTIRPAYAGRAMLKQLVGYGSWNFLISVAAMARSQLSPLLVGGVLGLGAVGPFSIVMRLPAMAMMILTAATGVYTPVAVALHASNDHVGRQRLLVNGTRLSLSLALYFLGLFICLGEPLLAIWIRPDFVAYWPVLVIIACGEVLPMTMSVATGMVQAMAQHRRLAWLAIAEAATTLVAALVFSSSFGLIGFVAALASGATLFRGGFVLAFVCRVTSTKVVDFMRQTLLAPTACGVAGAFPFYLIVRAYPPTQWPSLFLYAGLFTIFYGVSVVGGLIGWRETISAVHKFRLSRVTDGQT